MQHAQRQPRRRSHPRVGSLIVAHTWTAAAARTQIPQTAPSGRRAGHQRSHDFLDLPCGVDDLLAEPAASACPSPSRTGDLPPHRPELLQASPPSAHNKLIFTVGADDARDLARHTQPHLDDYDLGHLDAFHAAARLLDHAALTPAFTLRTRPLAPPHPPR